MKRTKTRILMVCLGNICRSPLAEGILRSKVDPERVDVDSAGTAGYHQGSSPDDRSITVARKFGIDISRQRCRIFQAEDFAEFDLIYVMDRENLEHILSLATSKEERQKVRLLLEEAGLDIREVPDPYYGGPAGFEHVYRLIDRACDAICLKLSKNQGI
jgi:protein-tyrosine phosphatase